MRVYPKGPFGRFLHVVDSLVRGWASDRKKKSIDTTSKLPCPAACNLALGRAWNAGWDHGREVPGGLCELHCARNGVASERIQHVALFRHRASGFARCYNLSLSNDLIVQCSVGVSEFSTLIFSSFVTNENGELPPTTKFDLACWCTVWCVSGRWKKRRKPRQAAPPLRQ